MFRPRNIHKDKMYYKAFKSVLSEYGYIAISPSHSVAIYEDLLKFRLTDRSHCFMIKVAKIYNQTEKIITNYGAAQYYYKTFHRHLINYNGEGVHVVQSHEALDFDTEFSFYQENSMFE
ncbi:hypothetical protein SS50377_24262 [Spironucleus salmonicida]|uniref:Uncharacterized protein n=1 Tax=Spironucleus salmonicida TaxID=348837 RepID=A0A9P8LTX4_9EUKA|nr:hypothetical protein SS50377_24262 [Spironucleus salmonicida]